MDAADAPQENVFEGSSDVLESFDFDNYTETPGPIDGNPPNLTVILITVLGAVLIMVLATSILCIKKTPEENGIEDPLLLSRQQKLLQSYT